MKSGLPSSGGNPELDNDRRASDKALSRTMRGWMRLKTPGGRRRKKDVMKVEGARLRELVIAVANELQRKAAQ
jgi:hypothetical protein